MVHEIQGISPVKQQTPYSCGIGAIETVFRYHGKKTGDNLRYIGEAGASHGQLMEIAKENGFELEHLGGSLAEVEKYVLRNTPVIVNYQDYGPNDGENGHYAVVVGISPDKIKLADPAEGGKVKWVSRSWFRERWHDPYEPGQPEQWAAILKPTSKEADNKKEEQA